MEAIDESQSVLADCVEPSEEDFLAADREAEAREAARPELGRFPNRAEKLTILGLVVSRIAGFESALFERLFGFPPELRHEVLLCAFWVAILALVHVLLPEGRPIRSSPDPGHGSE